MLCYLPKGLYGNSYISAVDSALHILKYDVSGNFQGGVKLDIKTGGSVIGSTNLYIHNNNQYYLSGTFNYLSDNVYIGSTKLTGGSFLASFRSSGQLDWFKENSGDTRISQTTIADDGAIYTTGECKANGSFAGQTFMGTGHLRPFVMKLNSSGNLIWAKDALDNTAASANGIAVRNSGEVIISGQPGLKIGWPGWPIILEQAPNTGYRQFVARFNTHTGKILGLDTIARKGGAAYSTVMMPDGKNSVYIGGNFAGSITVNGTTKTNTGGNTDWSIVRYGYNCGCKEVPEPKFSYSVSNGSTVTMNYTGTSYSSIKWDFGDGTTDNTASPSHTFPANSYQTICVTVTKNCGDNVYCENIPLWPTRVNEVSPADGITLYPNPAQSQLTIKGAAAGTTFRVFNIIGKQLLQTTTTTNDGTIDISQLPPGSYLLHLNTGTSSSTKKFVKE
jgi:hypothetical protein